MVCHGQHFLSVYLSVCNHVSMFIVYQINVFSGHWMPQALHYTFIALHNLWGGLPIFIHALSFESCAIFQWYIILS